MSFRVELLLTADGQIARAEIRKVGEETEKVRTATERAANTNRKATGETVALGRANNVAAGQVGNLTAQFNDIGMMMAAGQNPLQLAIQQGTQITQVIGPMGAAGAVRALGSAFMGMLNPVSLVTIGAIAAGAAMFQWLTSAGEDAASLADRIDELSGSVDAYRKSLDTLRTPMVQLRRDFGDQAVEVRAVYGALADLARLDAMTAMSAATTSLTEEMAGLATQMLIIQQVELQNRDNTNAVRMRRVLKDLQEDYGLTQEQARRLLDAMNALTTAVDPEQQAAAFGQLRDLMMGIRDEAGNIPEPLREVARAIFEGNLSAQQMVATLTDGTRAAEAMLAQLNAEADLRRIVAIYGEDSVQAAEARWDAEEKTLRAQLEGQGVAQALADEVVAAARAAFDAEQATAAWAASMAGVRGEVNAILASLASLGGGIIGNAAKQAEIQALRAGKSVRDAQKAAQTEQRDRALDARAEGANWFEKQVIAFERGVIRYGDALDVQLDQEREAARERDRAAAATGGGVGGGARATAGTDRQADAIRRLIEREREQLELLREADPVQKEMLRNREALAGATDAERAAVEAMITTRHREEAAIDQLQAREDMLRQGLYDVFRGISRGGDEAASAIDRVADALEEAAWQALLLGEGPLADLFGSGLGGGKGGLLGGLAKGLAGLFGGKFVDGGLIPGPGSGTSDDVIIRASSGEFMVNAEATRHHRGLLEMINAGGPIPGYATGGAIGAGAGGGMAPDLRPQIVIENHSSAQVDGRIEESVDGAGRRKSRLVLADAVGRAMTTPGGGARRTLRGTYGLQPRGALR